jgi:8-oxo-dGTP pyrophosphatase MutT (NUDIX family)
VGERDWDLIAGRLARHRVRPADPPITHRAAVALLLRDGCDDRDCLFIRRAEHPADPWSGQMAFPGGRSEPDDKGLLTTALRETREEIGVDLARDGQLLGALDELRAAGGPPGLALAIAPFVFRVDPGLTLRLSSEAQSAHWIAWRDLRAPENQVTLEHLHAGQRFVRPSIRCGGLIIWGLTYAMFTNLVSLLGDEPQPETPGARQ